MDESDAQAVADALGGRIWHSGGDMWLVLFDKPDGHLVVISDEAVCEYASEADFEQSKQLTSILFS